MNQPTTQYHLAVGDSINLAGVTITVTKARAARVTAEPQEETPGATLTLTVGHRLTLTAEERLVLTDALIARRQDCSSSIHGQHVAAVCNTLLHRIGDLP